MVPTDATYFLPELEPLSYRRQFTKCKSIPHTHPSKVLSLLVLTEGTFPLFPAGVSGCLSACLSVSLSLSLFPPKRMPAGVDFKIQQVEQRFGKAHVSKFSTHLLKFKVAKTLVKVAERSLEMSRTACPDPSPISLAPLVGRCPWALWVAGVGLGIR